MSKKEKKAKVKEMEKIATIVRSIIVAIATGLLGFLGGWIFEGRVLLTVIVFGFLCIGCVAAWLISYIYTKKINILSMMDEDIKKRKYESTIKFGCSVSRALHLAGRNWERYKIAEKVCDALKALPSNQEIKINDRTEKVSFLRAKMLLDDCGWSLYSINPFLYKRKAERKIMEGISACVRMIRLGESNDKVYETAFIGLRHMFGMVIGTFDREEKDKLINNQTLLMQYIKDCQYYGGLLGYLLGDERMYDANKKQEYERLFFELCLEADTSGDVLTNLRIWTQRTVNNRENRKFRQSTYNFRAKYFYTMYRAMKMLDNKQDDMLQKYWIYAKEMALVFALGYARKKDDLDCLYSTFYAKDIEKYKNEWFSSPDSERMVKAFLLLGKVAMISEITPYLFDAKELFEKTVNLSRGSRLDTYIAGQKCIIAVNERLLNVELANPRLNDEAKLEKVEEVLKEMEKIQKECVKTAPEDFVDAQMNKSCERRKKRYKKLISKYKRGKDDN